MIEVYLNDAKMSYDEGEVYFMNAEFWARDNCTSFKGCHIQDVSDVSYVYDTVGLYLFENEKDATMFTLKWKR